MASNSALNDPAGITIATDGAIWIVERGGNVLRRIDPSGHIRSVVGNGASGFSADLQSPAYDRLNAPSALAFAGASLIVAEAGGHRIRQVNLQQADVLLTASGLPTRVDPGSSFQVTVQVSNSGPLDSGFVRLAASTSSHFKVLGSATNTGSCRASAPPECNLGILAPGAQATVVLNLEAVVTGIGQLSVMASGTRADLNSANDTIDADIRSAPDLVFTNGFE